VLRTEAISVSFGGVNAITNVGFEAEAGRVTGLIGPNGAGKTTMFNVITGLQKPNQGRVYIDGVDVTRSGPKRRARLGTARTFQRLEVFGSLSVRDNVLVALESRHGLSPRANRAASADALLERVGLLSEADTPADVLPTGTARLLEMARCLATGPKVLLLDEVSSGLGTDESSLVGDLLVGVAREGVAVLLVEHDMDLVMGICDHICVLDFGRLIATGTPVEVRSDPNVQAAYLGTKHVDVDDVEGVEDSTLVHERVVKNGKIEG
jgi:branched-chain amino acid transport system ATP-binding protein